MTVQEVHEEITTIIDREDLSREDYKELLENILDEVGSRLDAMNEEDENMGL